MKGFKDLIVYQKAFALAMEIFEITKKFPKEETYSLIDQLGEVHALCADASLSHIEKGNIRHIL